ncbi:MAG TPA: NAD-dependent succinate-semialdehyde dehydrogenase [Burkholderiaceae bacterium]
MNSFASPMVAPYADLSLYIGGRFISAENRATRPVINPADGLVLGSLPLALASDLDNAVYAAGAAFVPWRNTSAIARSDLLRKTASLLRERVASIAAGITMDEGKPLTESCAEVLRSAEHLEWHAEEGRRVYGRVIPARESAVHQYVVREPVGVVAAFTPWNFPLSQAVRKVAAALGCGCTMVIKGPEDAPSGLVALAHALHDAGLPPGCLNVVWGDPAQISAHLIDSPGVHKVSFTGSVPVGKQLAARAAAQMKRITMELGGHAPVMVFDDVDVEATARMLVRFKLRNAGQVCVSPSRFYVHQRIHDAFLEAFVDEMAKVRIGNGLRPGTEMGPLAQIRRVSMMQRLVEDARQRGAAVHERPAEEQAAGHGFFMPVALSDIDDDALVMTQEPFGPVAPVVPFGDFDEVMRRANSLPFGLSSYVFTRAGATAHRAARELHAGMVNVNHFGGGMPEAPFGGVGDSGIGSEGGSETFDGYLVTKFVTML